MHLILTSIFIWFKAKPEFAILFFSSRWVSGQWTVWPFPTRREEELIDATPKADIEQQDTQPQMMATIKQADSVVLQKL